MKPSFLSIIPPFLTIFLAVTIKKTRLALFSGLVLAALISANFNPIQAALNIFSKYFQILEIENFISWDKFINSSRLFIFMFLIVLSCIIKLIKKSGIAFDYALYLKEKAKNKIQAQIYSVFLTIALFIEEDLSIITSSCVSPIVTDKFKISRLKLSYLISNFSSPVCSIVPISSWAAIISLILENSGVNDKILVGQSAYTFFIKASAFSFVPQILILSGFVVILKNISFGIIGKSESIAKETGNLFSGLDIPENENLELEEQSKNKPYSNKQALFNFIFPILSMPIIIIFFMFATGKAAGYNQILSILSHSKLELSLFLASLCSLFFVCTILIKTKDYNFASVGKLIALSIYQSIPMLITISLAWTFANFLRFYLKTGKFIALTFFQLISIKFMPIFLFLLAGILAFSMGTSWGTLAILIPIALPMVAKLLMLKKPILISSYPIFYSAIGALISGALIGNMVSPIGYLTMLNAKNLEIEHINMIKAHFQYYFFTIILASILFISSGFYLAS